MYAMLRHLVATAVLTALIAFALPAEAQSQPVARASDRGRVITLFAEPCQLGDAPKLPSRATWEEGGKVWEGCFGIFGTAGVVVIVFDDRSVAAIPTGMFVAVRGL